MTEPTNPNGMVRQMISGWKYDRNGIASSPKMSYKSRFRPLEALTRDGWCDLPGRTEERRGGKEGCGTDERRWWPVD